MNNHCERCGARIHTSAPWCPRDCSTTVLRRSTYRSLAHTAAGLTTLTALCLAAFMQVTS